MVSSTYFGGFYNFRKRFNRLSKILGVLGRKQIRKKSNIFLTRYSIFLHIWVTYWLEILPDFLEDFLM